MAETNVKTLPGFRSATPQVRDDLVEVLEWLLAEAKDGHLQSFVGVGIAVDGSIKRAYCPCESYYSELGALQYLVHLYCRDRD
jgi:hypothetical protein